MNKKKRSKYIGIGLSFGLVIGHSHQEVNGKYCYRFGVCSVIGIILGIILEKFNNKR